MKETITDIIEGIIEDEMCVYASVYQSHKFNKSVARAAKRIEDKIINKPIKFQLAVKELIK
jgi:hypothetical protein